MIIGIPTLTIIALILLYKTRGNPTQQKINLTLYFTAVLYQLEILGATLHTAAKVINFIVEFTAYIGGFFL
jgi:hypothetical protein